MDGLYRLMVAVLLNKYGLGHSVTQSVRANSIVSFADTPQSIMETVV